MIGAHMLDNAVAWFVQICAVSLLGTLLPLAFRIRHPRTQLAFGYGVLIVCLLLPVLQPRRIAAPGTEAVTAPATGRPSTTRLTDVSDEPNPTVVAAPAGDATDSMAATAAALPGVPSSQPGFSRVRLSHLALWILGAFAGLGLIRFALGLWQIRRYTAAATPMFPLPESVKEAIALVGTRAAVCLSPDVTSPATLGLLRPIVLLPASFLDLEYEAQRAVVCHELLHVRRGDWILALFEGLVGALLWCSPVAWLLAEIRLAREQVVDAEVVRLTSAHEPYVHALLDMSRMRSPLDIAPAPLFIRRRHLTQRVQALLDDTRESLARLSLRYASASALLVAGGWLAMTVFPLVGLPAPLEAAPSAMGPVRSAAPDLVAPAATDRADMAAGGPRSAAAPAIPAAQPESQAGEEPRLGTIELASSPGARAAVLGLLERAKQNNDLHIAGTPPFHLEASFDASGSVQHVGAGTLSQTWLSGQRWRWTASLGSYDQTRLGSGNVGYDESPIQAVPTRVQMLRQAIFWPVRVPGERRLRVASARIGRLPVTCVLLGRHDTPAPAERLWNEEEYCIDAEGLPRMFSPALGVYTHFDYSRAIRFGGRVLPAQIATFLDGAPVIAARLTIVDAGSPDARLFEPTPDMTSRGLGIALTTAPSLTINLWRQNVAADTVVVVHASVDPSGAVRDAEVAYGDPQLISWALDRVRAHAFPATGTQRDIYVGLVFHSGAPVTP